MTRPSNKNSFLEQLEQEKEQQRHVTAKTKRKHFPVDHRTRYSTFVVTLCFIVTSITFIITLCIYNSIALNIIFFSLALSHGYKEGEK